MIFSKWIKPYGWIIDFYQFGTTICEIHFMLYACVFNELDRVHTQIHTRIELQSHFIHQKQSLLLIPPKNWKRLITLSLINASHTQKEFGFSYPLLIPIHQLIEGQTLKGIECKRKRKKEMYHSHLNGYECDDDDNDVLNVALLSKVAVNHTISHKQIITKWKKKLSHSRRRSRNKSDTQFTNWKDFLLFYFVCDSVKVEEANVRRINKLY